MKKSLFALAAVGAFAGAAQAQSSVTVYGILDVGYTGGTVRSQAGSAAATTTNVSRISNSMESGSRLGFRGNEDLGGGTSAQFVFEVGIQPAGNAGTNPNGAADQAAGSSTWAPNVRQAFVGLSQKGLGQVRIGTQNTLYWEQAGSNTAGQLAQTLGSMLAPTSAGAFVTNPTALGTSNAVNGSASDAYTSRTTNTINIRTERMAGVMLKGSYTQSNQDTNQGAVTAGNVGYTGGNNNQTAYQLAFDWNIQKANIQGSYASFKSENSYNYSTAQANGVGLGGVAVTSGGPAAWGTAAQGSNVTDNQALVTASYDFGILRAYVGWAQRKVTSGINSNAYVQRTAQEIGVRGYATKTIEYWGSVGNGRFSAFGTGQPTANIVGYQLGSNYWMSKRTNLYAIYGQNGTSSTSNGSFNASQYSLGVRHTF